MAPSHPTLPHQFTVFKKRREDFPAGPVVKNLPCNAGYMDSVPGRGTMIPYAKEQLSLQAATIEPTPQVKSLQ